MRPPTNSSGQKKKRPPGGNKTEITVSQTCRFLELNDYPLAVANHSTEFLADFDKFSRFFMPLVASVNPGRSKLRVETLVMAKWGRVAAGWRSCGCIQAWDKGNLASGGNLAGGWIDLVGAEFGFAALLGWFAADVGGT